MLTITTIFYLGAPHRGSKIVNKINSMGNWQSNSEFIGLHTCRRCTTTRMLGRSITSYPSRTTIQPSRRLSVNGRSNRMSITPHNSSMRYNSSSVTSCCNQSAAYSWMRYKLFHHEWGCEDNDVIIREACLVVPKSAKRIDWHWSQLDGVWEDLVTSTSEEPSESRLDREAPRSNLAGSGSADESLPPRSRL